MPILMSSTMKTCIVILWLALVAPIYGKSHSQWHSRFHHHHPSNLTVIARATATLSSVGSISTGQIGNLTSTSNCTSGSGYNTTYNGTYNGTYHGPYNGTFNSPSNCTFNSPSNSTSNSTSSSPPSSPSSSPSNGPSNGPSSSLPGSDLGLSSNCYRPNGVPMGWLPDDVNIMSIQNQVGPPKGPCTYGNYAQITSATSMSGPDAQMQLQPMNSSLYGAIYIIALQPFIPFAQVSASAVAASMEKLLDQGPEIIWLRLAHEVNWYIDTNYLNTDPTVKYHGTTAEYKAMWQAVANAVDRSRVKMFWSLIPPFAPGDTVDTMDKEWFPGNEYVDIAGLDAYGEILSGEQSTFEFQMGAFCKKYPDIPIALAETGWLQGGTAEQKKFWLQQISAKETMDVCPQYIGFSWFEYVKDGDYRIVGGDDGNIAKEVLADAS